MRRPLDLSVPTFRDAGSTCNLRWRQLMQIVTDGDGAAGPAVAVLQAFSPYTACSAQFHWNLLNIQLMLRAHRQRTRRAPSKGSYLAAFKRIIEIQTGT